MRKGFLVLGMLIALVALISVSGIFGQQRRKGPPPASSKPAANDLKIKYRQNMGGQIMESTTMLKGKRERTETKMASMNSANITQCDLRRHIQINETSQKYLIVPMDTVDTNQPAAPASNPPAAQPAQPTRTGGVITYTTTATDTGERKEMFGFTARHVKTTVSIESSPDACTPMNQRIETDGWYIDLAFGLDCESTPAMIANPMVRPVGCRDRTQFRRQGAARTGYPLSETMTMYGPNGQSMFTMTKEVVELSREPLDSALFDVPVGYIQAADAQELYSMAPSADAMGNPSNQDSQTDRMNNAMSGSSDKRPGTLRVGVVTFNNKAGKPVSIDSLRERLVSGIESSGVDAVSLNAISQAEAEVEAKAKQCDFILYTDIISLKSSAAKKIGGIFGKAVGASNIDKTEAKVDFKLFATGESSPRLQSSVTAKEEGDEASAGTAIDSEAKQVASAVGKRS